MKVLVIAGDRLGDYDPLTAHGVAAGLLLGEVTVLAAGSNSLQKANAAAKIPGVCQVLQATHTAMTKPGVENLALLISELTDSFDIFLAVATTFGNDLIPRTAALASCSPITNIAAITTKTTVDRPIHSGAILASQTLPDPPFFLTVRHTAYATAEIQPRTFPAPIKPLPHGKECNLSNHQNYIPSQNQRPDPADAKVVVAGGGGLQAGGDFAPVEKLADHLRAAVGASRAAVDLGLASNDLQIGQTGRNIAPDLYIGMGISGAIQHLAGIKEARMIVSINTDPNAPIHNAADYALTADLYTVVAELLADQ